MTFLEFLRKGKRKKFKAKFPSNLNQQNFSGANNYINAPAAMPNSSRQGIDGFSDSNSRGSLSI